MRKYFLFALLFVCIFASHVFAKGAFEFSWKTSDLNYDVLVVVPDDTDAVMGIVRMTDRDGSHCRFVEEKFVAKVEDKGIVFVGYNTPSGYTPDNFVIHESGEAFSIKKEGEIRPMKIRIISEDDVEEIVAKYELK